ncbi:MAG: DUF1824 family protein [Gloeocapsa sp. DLM2.Bin57]|nr:MAG: DUF1824 family protein [Gloeocapsa sp. DLM2.Bin57]
MIQQAVAILKQYSCTNIKPVETPEAKQELQQAILQVAKLSEYQNLGICADNLQQGLDALANYLQALGYNFPLPSLDKKSLTPVYLKFNTKKQNFYLDDYDGDYRGVLISYQGEDLDIMGTYGYFPLDLF